MEEKLLTIDEVAQRLHLQSDTVSKFIREGKITPVVRISRRIRLVPESSLDAYIKQHTGTYKG